MISHDEVAMATEDAMRGFIGALVSNSKHMYARRQLGCVIKSNPALMSNYTGEAMLVKEYTAYPSREMVLYSRV